VIAHAYQVQPGHDHIEWVPDDAHDFVALKLWSKWHTPGRMSFNDPAAIINDVFAFHPHHLQGHVEVQGVVGAGLDAGEELEVLAEEGVA
jgi:hypothetical protein